MVEKDLFAIHVHKGYLEPGLKLQQESTFHGSTNKHKVKFHVMLYKWSKTWIKEDEYSDIKRWGSSTYNAIIKQMSKQSI